MCCQISEEIFQAGKPSVSYLKKHELLCLYSSLDVANHTGGV